MPKLRSKAWALCGTKGVSHANLLIEGFTIELYLDPKSKQHISPKPLKLDSKAIMLHIFGVQVVGLWRDMTHGLTPGSRKYDYKAHDS